MPKARIEGQAGGEIDCKRFYIPGLLLFWTCVKCGKEQVKDFQDEYLMYPVIGETFFQNLHCRDCEHEDKVKVRLEVKLELAEDG